ncbi:DUF3572 domain-containing protein [Parvibaculum sp.]|jgi:hypothetical protein|uniref:DUF3572 domain-containing protein n=1 Tax=Parvibaculum sp. TaxID=2024848 RepID=UPI000C411540|nr:DUF3572 domain-containing protein [Parvibaculum sp.]MAM93869.1 hypothetical protein [Parvibaculum sp.]HCX66155.1 DUF3572 domain-containing protein [Rhodobiaceae bacterium]|tara:strand:+ start:14010 stop:14288 length:279 start_codon:yes stop_codon:yes gene_type:complete
MTRDEAELLAIRALGHIAADEDLLGDFLALSGLSVDELRSRAGEAEFLGAILDFLLSDEARLLAFCESEELDPRLPGRARVALPGGEQVEWT